MSGERDGLREAFDRLSAGVPLPAVEDVAAHLVALLDVLGAVGARVDVAGGVVPRSRFERAEHPATVAAVAELRRWALDVLDHLGVCADTVAGPAVGRLVRQLVAAVIDFDGLAEAVWPAELQELPTLGRWAALEALRPCGVEVAR
jgi:hypothetical protein